MKQHNLLPEDVIMIGDSADTDRQFAINLDCDFIHIRDDSSVLRPNSLGHVCGYDFHGWTIANLADLTLFEETIV